MPLSASRTRSFKTINTSARNGNSEEPVYFLIAKQGYTIRQMDIAYIDK
jgi:hypothetical protein